VSHPISVSPYLVPLPPGDDPIAVTVIIIIIIIIIAEARGRANSSYTSELQNVEWGITWLLALATIFVKVIFAWNTLNHFHGKLHHFLYKLSYCYLFPS
jgi:hypothetical protein